MYRIRQRGILQSAFPGSNSFEYGGSLLSTMAAICIGITITVFFSSAMLKTQAATIHNLRKTDLTSLRLHLPEKLNCRATLGIAANAALPISCDDSDVHLLRWVDRNGVAHTIGDHSGKIGSFRLRGVCRDTKILGKISRSLVAQYRPIRGDPLKGAREAPTVWKNLFHKGTIRFCRSFVDAGYQACPNSDYPAVMGPGPECCRRVVGPPLQAAPADLKLACAPSEYLKRGGGYCMFKSTNDGDRSCSSVGGLESWTGQAATVTYAGKWQDPNTNEWKWRLRCAAPASHDNTVACPENDAVAVGWAMCCPVGGRY